MTIDADSVELNSDPDKPKQKFYPLVPVVTNSIEEVVVKPDFEVSPGMVDSHTASIVLDELPESKNMSHVLETGEILTTGAIDISMFTTHTGEIETTAEITDSSAVIDAQLSNVSSIAPIRAADTSYFGSDLSIVPAKLKRGEGQLYLALTISIALVGIGSLVLAGYMLRLI
jgi:hypothetical protein